MWGRGEHLRVSEQEWRMCQWRVEYSLAEGSVLFCSQDEAFTISMTSLILVGHSVYSLSWLYLYKVHGLDGQRCQPDWICSGDLRLAPGIKRSKEKLFSPFFFSDSGFRMVLFPNPRIKWKRPSLDRCLNISNLTNTGIVRPTGSFKQPWHREAYWHQEISVDLYVNVKFNLSN